MDYPDGYVEVTGMMSLQQRQYYCLTLCYRSITTGELKQLKLCSLQRRPASSSRYTLDTLSAFRMDVYALRRHEQLWNWHGGEWGTVVG